MKQNSSTVSGTGRIDAADVDVLTALIAPDDAATQPAGSGPARRISSLTGAAMLAVAAAILAIGLAGGVASAAAASIPESEAMAAADAGAGAPEPMPASSPSEAAPQSGPVEEGRWEYAFAPVQWMQRDTVLAANVAPAPQPEGYGWALINMTIHNVGAESATPGRFEVVLRAGGWEVSHVAVGRQPVRMPDEYSARELAPGEQASGNLGFWLPDYAADARDCRIELRVYPSTDGSYTSHWLTCD